MTEVYKGLHPDEIDSLPSDRVLTDLLLYQTAYEFNNRKRK